MLQKKLVKSSSTNYLVLRLIFLSKIKRQHKIIKNKPEKNVRFKNIQNISDNTFNNDIYLLWKKYNK